LDEAGYPHAAIDVEPADIPALVALLEARLTGDLPLALSRVSPALAELLRPTATEALTLFETRTTKVMDSVLGSIVLEEHERHLINTPPVQRLRMIRQIGAASLVFPGALHTRFAHSLGVLELATRIYDRLAAASDEMAVSVADFAPEEHFTMESRALLRLAALLHDVGHAPFSHLTEALASPGYDADAYARNIICSSPIADIIHDFAHQSGFAFDSAVVADLARGTLRGPLAWMNRLLHAPLDADKLDYTLRDAIFCLGSRAEVDVEAIAGAFRIVASPPGTDHESAWVLALREVASPAIEAFFELRQRLFEQVYSDPAVRAYRAHLDRLLSRLGHTYPTDPSAFLAWDDARLLDVMQRNREIDHARVLLGEEERCLLVWTTSRTMTARERAIAQQIRDEVVPSLERVARTFMDQLRDIPSGPAAPLIMLTDAQQIAHVPPSRRWHLTVDQAGLFAARADFPKAVASLASLVATTEP